MLQALRTLLFLDPKRPQQPDIERQQPEKNGRGRIFISIDLGPLQALRAEFENRGAPVTDGWWGYDTMIIEDPDGNQLFFPYPKKEEEQFSPGDYVGLSGAKGRVVAALPFIPTIPGTDTYTDMLWADQSDQRRSS